LIIKAIVAVDANWGIGCKGQLLARIPADMKYFKDQTINKIVVMGQVTFESLPNRKPLPNRINIVLSNELSFTNPEVTICRSLEELWVTVKPNQQADTFVIGGESIYQQLLPFCQEALVTKIEQSFLADKYFPNLDKMAEWEMTEISQSMNYSDINFRFARYVRKVD
jgi:dihydrofolate reductase